jgi:hypothetical protein
MGRERQTERERERRERERKMTKFRKNIEPCAAIFKWKTTKSNSRRRDAPCIMLASMTPKLIFDVSFGLLLVLLLVTLVLILSNEKMRCCAQLGRKCSARGRMRGAKIPKTPTPRRSGPRLRDFMMKGDTNNK